MTAGLEVKPVTTASERKAFLRLPHAVFASDPAWIAPLAFERAQHISPKHNPFFQHATAQLFVAWQGDNPVGRISAQVDDLRNQRHRDATGMFGFLDAIDDARVFESLLRTAEGHDVRVGQITLRISTREPWMKCQRRCPWALVIAMAIPAAVPPSTMRTRSGKARSFS